jgi:chromosome partitioning protein
VLFDCPPGSEHLERLALVAANVALLALDAHPFGISGASRVLDVIAKRRAKQRTCPEVVALVPSRIDLRRSVDRSLGTSLNELFPGLPVLRVRQDLALATAAAEGIPITIAAPESRALEDLTAIKEWIHAQYP